MPYEIDNSIVKMVKLVKNGQIGRNGRVCQKMAVVVKNHQFMKIVKYLVSSSKTNFE